MRGGGSDPVGWLRLGGSDGSPVSPPPSLNSPLITPPVNLIIVSAVQKLISDQLDEATWEATMSKFNVCVFVSIQNICVFVSIQNICVLVSIHNMPEEGQD